jgi:hypothetical protein
MVFDSEFPGRVRFVAHAVREIRDRLPDVVSGLRGRGPVQYKNRCDEIAKEWERAGFPLDGTIPVSVIGEQSIPTHTVPVPRRLFRKIATLIQEHVNTRETRKEKAFRLFESLAPQNQELRDQFGPIVLHWFEVTEWFVEKVHDPGYQEDIDEEELKEHFELFEKTLMSLVGEFFRTVEELDEILEEANA